MLFTQNYSKNLGEDRSLLEPEMYDIFQSLTDLTAAAISRLQFTGDSQL